MDADAAVVTTIALDHLEWLGDTRELIGFEKAGIFREGKPAICGDFEPPQALMDYADLINAKLYCQQKNFHFQEKKDNWSWSYADTHYDDLPFNHLLTQNMSTALMTITVMQPLLPVPLDAIKTGLATVNLPGRIQIKRGAVTEIFDVSHNPAAVALLASKLQQLPRQGKIRAVFSMLVDKDVSKSIEAIKNEIDVWYVAPLAVKRAASAEVLLKAFSAQSVVVKIFSDVCEAYKKAKEEAVQGDCVVVFGSFHILHLVMPACF